MKLGELLDSFRGMRALVVGDLMIDEYIFGRVSRVSPEAPVMVVRHDRTERLPGGAANVARNLLAFGVETCVVGLVGHDGGQMVDALENFGVADHALVFDPQRPTTRKTRVIADRRHQLLRIDDEVDQAPDSNLADLLIRNARASLDRVQVLLFSDYQKGTLSPAVVESLLESARNRGVDVISNAKPASFELYRGAQMVSLNRAEASAVLGWTVTFENSERAVQTLAERIAPSAVLLTLGEHGMIAAHGDEVIRIRAPRVEVADPAGAGDTTIAAAALGWNRCRFDAVAFELAAQAAACVVQHVGVATPTESDFRRLGELESGILTDYASPK